ncbi:MAG: hypothetical protein ABI954_13130 [Pyrinomonadaceae bacterium]
MQENETAETASTDETATEATETTAPGETAENKTENIAEGVSFVPVETADDQAAPALTDDNSAENAPAEDASAQNEKGETVPETPAEPEEEEEITYHAVQKEDSVTAIWEMQGRKHIRTIDPRSREGAEILRLFTAEEGEEIAA